MCARPKIIAFYLPQFHRIPENDNWWGENFTDWVAVQQAKPLYPGHAQPRIPRNEYYYDLMEKATMEWQAQQAKKFGIYGFCIYHYWFGEKQLLEKPAENLLRWKDIDVHYCFSWANESWIASWSKLEGNAWFYGTNNKPAKGGCLVEQKYGDEREWKRHFEYLLPFFEDKRYIRKNNCPVFIIYKPDKFDAIKNMMKYWNDLALAHGLQGIYFIGTNDDKWRQKGFNAMVQYEPSYTFGYEKNTFFKKGFYFENLRNQLEIRGFECLRLAKYTAVWNRILERKSRRGVFPGMFVDFDSTPRKGRTGTVFMGARPKNFEKYMKRFLTKYGDKEFLFITAWNEWGEGAYLEPDRRNGSKYLQAVRKCLKSYERDQHREDCRNDKITRRHSR